jgi:hypothetical protein
MLTKNQDWIKKDDYFRHWSRVLVRGGGDYNHQVEIWLTPINNDSEKEWATVGDVFITRHDVRYSAFKDRSLWTHHLPDEIYKQMLNNIGAMKTDVLLNGDIYSLIDWNKFARHDNGGCPLSLCRKDFAFLFEYTGKQLAGIVTSQSDENIFRLMIPELPKGQECINVGAVVSNLPGNHFVIHGRYNMITGYISFDLTLTLTERTHTSQFSQRLKVGWEDTLIEYIKCLKDQGEITQAIENSVTLMINRANAELKTFKL